MSGQYIMVAGIGHCGTKWLATVLAQPAQGVRFFHEHRYTITPMRWDNWLRMEYDCPKEFSESLQCYAEKIRARLGKYRVVGDAISWMPLSIPKVNESIKISRIIYLVRNGVPQLNSIWYHSQFGRRKRDAWLFTSYMKYYWDLMGKPYWEEWSSWTRWEKTCLWWAASAFMPGWLRAKLPKVKLDVYRLEDLTGDVQALGELVVSLGLEINREELITYQETDINRKVKGSRDPATIWAAWAEEQRRVFGAICGEGMVQLGYEIPTRQN